MATIERAAARGMVQKDIAYLLGFSERTLRRRFNDTPEADEAYRRGRANAIYEVAGRLYDDAVSGTGKEGVTSRIFWLKTQAGWKEGQVIEHKTDDGGLRITVTPAREDSKGSTQEKGNG